MTGAKHDIQVETRPLTASGYALALTLATVSGAGAVARALRNRREVTAHPKSSARSVLRVQEFEFRTAAN